MAAGCAQSKRAEATDNKAAYLTRFNIAYYLPNDNKHDKAEL